jgi:hypothetical protein
MIIATSKVVVVFVPIITSILPRLIIQSSVLGQGERIH